MSNFRASRIVLVKYMSSVCALTEDIYKNDNLDKQHPLFASILCHSNTTISLAMLNPALTFQIHSNATISLNILAPTLPARLLQMSEYELTCLVAWRGNNFRSRSQRIWCRTQSMLQVLTKGCGGVREESRRTVDGLPRGSQIAYMIYDHFQATGASDAAQDLSDLFNVCLHDDDVQDFDTRWDQILLATSGVTSRGMSWKVCT